jgi:hypothetical protein
VRSAVQLERQRDLPAVPGHGIGQLEMIAWTSVSTAKSNPGPGLLVIHSLRDVLARWAAEEPGPPGQRPAPVVYTDTVPAQLMGAVESLAVVASESMQHQTLAEILHTFAVLFTRLPPDQQARAEDIILRALSGVGDQILTGQLERELSSLATVLSECGRADTASAVRAARDTLGRSSGRPTRVRRGSRRARLKPRRPKRPAIG